VGLLCSWVAVVAVVSVLLVEKVVLVVGDEDSESLCLCCGHWCCVGQVEIADPMEEGAIEEVRWNLVLAPLRDKGRSVFGTRTGD
jgi:hypothetical protein